MSTYPEVTGRTLQAEFTATYADGTTALIPVVVKACETRVNDVTTEVFRDRRGQIGLVGPGRYGVQIQGDLYPESTWFVARWHVVHPVTGAEGFFDTDHFMREGALIESTITGLSVQRTVSEVGSVGENRHLTAIEIIRRELLLLRRYNGTYVAFFIKNDTGEKCVDCWDSVLQRTTRSDCKGCYGTGYQVGYSQPILGYCYHNAPVTSVDLSSPIGERKREVGREFWAPPAPKLKPGDFFAKPDGSRWRLGDRDNTKLEGERGEHEVRQFADARRIDPDDIEQQIQVPYLDRPPESFVGFMTGVTALDEATGILIEASGAR